MIVGEASILIRPITAGFGKRLLEDADKELAGSGATAGARFGGMFAKGLAGIGIATAAIGIAAIKMGSDYQRSLLMIHTQAGATGENLGQITKQIFAMAPAVGFGPKALVDALYHIESVGYRGAQAMDILKIAAQGAKIGHEDLEKTANSLVATMASGITGFHGAAEAMGVLDAIIGAGNMRMDGLNAAIGTGLFASAQTFGISIQSVGAALAFMTDRGSGAQESATRLRMSIALMAAPSAAASKIMGTLGLSTTEVHARTTAMSEALKKAHITTSMLALDLRKPDGFEVALRHLKTALLASGVSAETASAIISRAFGGGRSGATIMAMYGNLDALKGKFDQIMRTSNNFGQSWAATQKTAAFQFDRFRALVETGLTRLGMFLLPQVTKAMKGVVDGIIAAGPIVSRAWHTIMGGFQHPDAKIDPGVFGFDRIFLTVGQDIRKFSDLLLPALRSAGAAIMGALGPTWDLIRNLARDLAPLAGILLAAFGGGVIVGIRAFAIVIRDVVTPLIRFLGMLAGNTAFQAFAVGLSTLLVPFGALLVVLKGMELATKAWTIATNIAKEAAIAFRFVMWLLNAAWEANPIGVVVLALTALAAGLIYAYNHSKTFRDIVQGALRAVGDAAAAAGRFFTRMWQDIVGAFDSVWPLIKRWGPLVLAVFAPFLGLPLLIVQHWGQITGFFTRLWGDVTGWVSRMSRDVAGFFGRMWADVTGWVVRLWHDVTGFFDRIKTDVSNVVTGILGFVDQHWRLLLVIFTGPIGLVIVLVDYFHKQIGAFFTQMWHDVSGAVTRLWRDVTTFFQVGYLAATAIVTSLWKTVVDLYIRLWHDVSSFVTRMWNDVTAFFHVGYLAVTAIVTSLWQTTVDLFTRLWRDVTNWVTRMWTDVTTFFHVGYLAVTAIVTSLWRTAVDLFTRLWTDVTNWVTRLWHDVVNFFTRMAADVWGVIGPFVLRIVGGFGDLWTGATGFASRLWHDVAGFFGRMRDDVVGIFDDLVTKAGRLWDRIKDLVAVPIRWVIENPYDKGIVPLIRGIGDILHEPGMQNLGELHFADGGQLPMRAIPGNHDRDTVPFYGTPGEVVVPKPVVARFGGPDSLMGALGFDGKGGPGHYAVGGPVLPPGLNFQGLSSFNPNSLQGSLTAGTATGAAAGRQFVTTQDALRISGGKADTGILGRIVHDIAHPTDLLGDLKKLALGALAIGATPVVHTIEGAADGALKSLGEPGRWMDKEVHNIGDALLSLLAGKDAAYNAAQAAAAAAGGGAGLLQVGNGTDIVNDARKYLGQQYILGGDPYGGGGTDCSGLVDRVMADLGHKLPGRPLTWDLVKMGTAVNYADALPGDLVFTNYGEGGIPGPGHVGIYEGGGRMIDDPNPSSHVREEAVWETPGAVRRLLVDHLPTAIAAAAVNGSWADVVYQALKMENLPASAAGGVLRLIQSESGGDANAVNLWDSNAQAGHPSQGLMQLIPDTFAANHWPGTSDNIRDPLANIAAGINYAVKTYGIDMLMGGGRHDGTGRYVGYEQGTMFVPSTGPATLHQGEIVIPRGPSDTIRQHMATGGVVQPNYAALYQHAVELYAKLITDQQHHLSPATIRADIARIAVANRAADVAGGHSLARHHATHHATHHPLHHATHHAAHHLTHPRHHPLHHLTHPRHHTTHHTTHHRLHHPTHHLTHHLTHHPLHHPGHHLAHHPLHHAAHHLTHPAHHAAHHAGWSALTRLHHLQHPSHHAAHHAGWSALARLHHPLHWSALQRAHHPLHWSALERLHHPHHYRHHPRVFDTGGYLGAAGGVNLSGRRERVLDPDETEVYDRTRGRSGTTVHQNNHFNGVDLPTAQAQSARELALALAGAGVG